MSSINNFKWLGSGFKDVCNNEVNVPQVRKNSKCTVELSITATTLSSTTKIQMASRKHNCINKMFFKGLAAS
jgi:hypothetical protein